MRTFNCRQLFIVCNNKTQDAISGNDCPEQRKASMNLKAPRPVIDRHAAPILLVTIDSTKMKP